MLISILISNYNKNKNLQKCIESCLNQSYSNIEIFFGDNESTDDSLSTAKKYGLTNIFTIKRKYESSALNQIHVINKLFNKSKGDLIFLLDSDDYFEKDKISKITEIFIKDNSKNVICDIPKIINLNGSFNKFSYKTNIDFKKRWPTIFPTSCITLRRKSLNDFFNFSFHEEYPDLEIDFRLATYFYNIKKELFIEKQVLTNYLQVENSISSKYKKYTFRWWRKRHQAFNFLKKILDFHNITHSKSIDYIVTSMLNKYI